MFVQFMLKEETGGTKITKKGDKKKWQNGNERRKWERQEEKRAVGGLVQGPRFKGSKLVKRT